MELTRLADSETASDIDERSDRREFSWRTVLYGFTLSRRRMHRRASDDVMLSDWGHPWLFFLAIGTMLLSATDAFLTLILLNHGMVEANPIMEAVMAQSIRLFTTTKLLFTAFGILTLVYLAKIRFLNSIRAGMILTLFFSFYACLICYELVNLFKLM